MGADMQISNVDHSVARRWTKLLEVLRQEQDREEECVCAFSFTSLQATPHPKAGQPAQKTHKKTSIWAPLTPNWIQRAMQHDQCA